MGTIRTRIALLAAACLLSPARALAAPTTITILHVNDTHSHLDAVGPKDRNLDGTQGGLAKAATVIAALKTAHPDALFVHAGDVFNGDAYFAAALGPGGSPLLSVPELRLLRPWLDVQTLGNHEFGLGTLPLASVLWAAYQGGGPSVLTANVDLHAAGLEGLVHPNVVKVVNGVRVGIFGMTAIDFLSQGAPFLAKDQEGTIELAAKQVAELRAPPASADVVIFLSHLGFELDQAVAARVPGIDAVVGGHDHLLLPKPVMVAGRFGKRVPVVQAGEFYEWVGELTLVVEGRKVSVGGYRLVRVDAGVPRLPEVAGEVEKLKAGIDDLAGEDLWHHPIARALLDVAQEPPARSRFRDSPVADLVTDALRARGGTDIALTAHGFLTEGLTRGQLVGDDAFRIVGDGIDPAGAGLGFPLYTLCIDGRNLLTALETSLALGGALSLEVSGMRYVYDSRRPAGTRLLAAYVGEEPVDPARTYRATVNLGVLQGLAEFPGVTVSQIEPLSTSEYLAVRDWMARLKLVLYFSHGRVVDVGMRQ